MNLRRRDDPRIEVFGLPSGVCIEEQAVFRAKVDEAARTFIRNTSVEALDLQVTAGHQRGVVPMVANGQPPLGKRDRGRRHFVATTPCLEDEELVLPDDIHDQLSIIFSMVRNRETLVARGFASTPVVNFVGPPGVGKTHAAHWVAAKLFKRIIAICYPDLESMYVAIGPRKVDALFRDAAEQDAAVFIDESDAAVSRRVLATQGSERADNSIKAKLLTIIGQHPGLLMLATNRFGDYDKAFVSRITATVHFPVPDEDCRRRLWEIYLRKAPLATDVSAAELARIASEFVGRDIKQSAHIGNAIALDDGRHCLFRRDLLAAIQLVRKSQQPSVQTAGRDSLIPRASLKETQLK